MCEVYTQGPCGSLGQFLGDGGGNCRELSTKHQSGAQSIAGKGSIFTKYEGRKTVQ